MVSERSFPSVTLIMATTVPTTNRHLLSGVEVLGEALLARRALDERDGLDTATFVSGYPGSPLGTLRPRPRPAR